VRKRRCNLSSNPLCPPPPAWGGGKQRSGRGGGAATLREGGGGGAANLEETVGVVDDGLIRTKVHGEISKVEAYVKLRGGGEGQ
jgi:hypothetical protein